MQTNDDLICEVNGGFILHRRLFLNTQAHVDDFEKIIANITPDEFVEVLINVLNENRSFTPEVFSIFQMIAKKGPTDLSMDFL